MTAPGLVPAGMAAKRDVVITKTANAGNDADQTSYTFASQSIGAASADRIVLVGVAASGGAPLKTVNAVTVGGNAASELIETPHDLGATGWAASAIYALSVPSGTTADIVVTFSAGASRCAIVVAAMTGASSAAAFQALGATNATALTVNLDIPANGAAFAVAFASGSVASATWSGLTENTDSVIEATRLYTAADAEFAGVQTNLAITCTFSSAPAASSMSAASWGPW